MRGVVAALVAFALVRVAGAAGCAPGVDTNAFLGPTHYGIGVRTLSLVDTTRITPAHDSTPELPQRTLDVEVWYPAGATAAGDQRDAEPAGNGPFPLIVVPCQSPTPSNPPMQALEQHRLTSAVVAAFFDATLGRSADARCFLAGSSPRRTRT